MASPQPHAIQTTDAGIPVESDEYSLTVGPGGPILLQDSYLIEQMANFNRERITERQPHAKGSGAFGRFEVTGDVSEYTKAALFQPGASTRMMAQIPVNAPVVPVNTDSKDGVMRMVNRTDPVYFPNSKGGPQADPERYQPASWYADGEIMHAAYVQHAEDDDWSQAGALVREVMDNAARDRLGDRVEKGVRAGKA
jgi:catalase